MAPLITAFAPDALVETALAAIFAPQPAPEGYADYVGAPLSLRRSSFRSNAHQVRMLKSHLAAMPPRYPSLDLPVEILHGTVDDIVPINVHSEMLARQIRGARLTRLQGIGRMPHHVRPDAVDAAIDRAAGRAALRLSGDAPGVLPETKTPCPSPSPATSAAGRSDNGDRSTGVKDPARWMKSRWAKGRDTLAVYRRPRAEVEAFHCSDRQGFGHRPPKPLNENIAAARASLPSMLMPFLFAAGVGPCVDGSRVARALLGSGTWSVAAMFTASAMRRPGCAT